jgi:hypothetical protein
LNAQALRNLSRAEQRALNLAQALMTHVGQADNGHDMRNALVNRIVIGAVKRHSGFMKCVGRRQDMRRQASRRDLQRDASAIRVVKR